MSRASVLVCYVHVMLRVQTLKQYSQWATKYQGNTLFGVTYGYLHSTTMQVRNHKGLGRD